MNNFEIISTQDKDARDRIYEDLRANGGPLERQVVKFSSVDPVLDEEGNPTSIWIESWSVAYPRTAGRKRWHG
jgi:hypothetical protein